MECVIRNGHRRFYLSAVLHQKWYFGVLANVDDWGKIHSEVLVFSQLRCPEIELSHITREGLAMACSAALYPSFM